MPKPFPRGFRADVLRVVRAREAGVTIAQIARDFGIHPGTVENWLKADRVEAGEQPGTTTQESAELRELRKRNRLLGAGERGAAPGGGVFRAGASAGKRPYPLVKELAVDGIPVTVSCRVLKLARQLYHRWLKTPVTTLERTQAYRADALFNAHRDDPEFGHRLLADEARENGEPMADRTAWRLCAENGWWSVFGKKGARGTGKKPGPAVHDDLCVVTDENGRTRHQFTAETVNELWLTDITEHKTREGKLYLCAVKDAFSGRIVGYSISDRMKSRLAVQALENAAVRRSNITGCVVHSDRGSQFRSRKFRRALTAHGLVGSMGRVASCGDNAAMESFFSLLQKNVLNRQSWSTREELRTRIVCWIERTYHRRRRQIRLGRLIPIEYETMMNTQAALAA